MADKVAGSRRGLNAGVQVFAAVVLVAGVTGGVWGLSRVLPMSGTDEPATCADGHGTASAKRVSGAQLCRALNRSDLPVLLGTPDEHARTADGDDGWITLDGGTRMASPEANVTLKTYCVKLSASEDRFSVSQGLDLLPKAEPRQILGHPAVLYSDRTTTLTLDSGKAGSGPGGVARSLLVAKDVKDGGGSFEISVWRQDDAAPDDAALFRVAELVLPTVPGWKSG
ncbi:DUF6215 domain-containing protein [Streptomyces triticiradicis]|uniref:Uncharacterized protein n=1 Tax=Streptomyces triticiradicis TaxID=2651189 RepID=A0A7J5DKM3_9ACTN|nr:DUF6215 domain-containing protein [Streptomyces triticiradicis]KAB1989219.1 hypothetical protein F8144_09280 [Streptomyces triticiradicis]